MSASYALSSSIALLVSHAGSGGAVLPTIHADVRCIPNTATSLSWIALAALLPDSVQLSIQFQIAWLAWPFQTTTEL